MAHHLIQHRGPVRKFPVAMDTAPEQALQRWEGNRAGSQAPLQYHSATENLAPATHAGSHRRRVRRRAICRWQLAIPQRRRAPGDFCEPVEVHANKGAGRGTAPVRVDSEEIGRSTRFGDEPSREEGNDS
jgi:hypothetical protein